MKHSFIISSLVSVSTLALLTLLGDPFDFFMLGMDAMLLIVIFAVAMLVFGSLIWLEGGGDEREVLHRASVARLAYLAGASILAVGIVIQTLNHTLDPWLPASLGVMVLSKVVAHIYYELKN